MATEDLQARLTLNVPNSGCHVLGAGSHQALVLLLGDHRLPGDARDELGVALERLADALTGLAIPKVNEFIHATTGYDFTVGRKRNEKNVVLVALTRVERGFSVQIPKAKSGIASSRSQEAAVGAECQIKNGTLVSLESGGRSGDGSDSEHGFRLEEDGEDLLAGELFLLGLSIAGLRQLDAVHDLLDRLLDLLVVEVELEDLVLLFVVLRLPDLLQEFVEVELGGVGVD
mmetsp:Transcript_34603/g.52944  ORF Transcript_34603/g.52944 Transcript_34603/m.52944 type:complete len:230 (-) Transcript_34603:154-843(-)